MVPLVSAVARKTRGYFCQNIQKQNFFEDSPFSTDVHLVRCTQSFYSRFPEKSGVLSGC